MTRRKVWGPFQGNPGIDSHMQKLLGGSVQHIPTRVPDSFYWEMPVIPSKLEVHSSLDLSRTHTMAPTHNAVLSTALKLPGLNKLYGKRVILASNSPRRREILKTYVRFISALEWKVHDLMDRGY